MCKNFLDFTEIRLKKHFQIYRNTQKYSIIYSKKYRNTLDFPGIRLNENFWIYS